MLAYKIAVASTDGKRINQHFGRSQEFLIFSADENGAYQLVEKREAASPCAFGVHADKKMVQAAENLSDCRYVLCAQIGEGAELQLAAKGIRAFAVPGDIPAILPRLIVYDAGKSARAKRIASQVETQ